MTGPGRAGPVARRAGRRAAYRRIAAHAPGAIADRQQHGAVPDVVPLGSGREEHRIRDAVAPCRTSCVRIVAWTITLGKPSATQIKYFNANEGGPASAGIAILRAQKSPKLTYKLISQSPVVPLE